ncbi:chromosome partitioning protein ParB [Histophilus somni]|uniref:Chromosome partitioning protein ParB n=1 Tax=Histophilus somni TaxID=731 RepID=A0A649Z2H1_HISSO|nr:ParB family protein [Histophilus somni]QEH12209.1 chromosome partitioning protein ParB [Histophilus somni]QEH26691.1 chromosome partitioning protein ParB [Histophilus somni]QEH50885.1 chromosome partitioning protein ParB [Histophilus somni]QGM49023.1 chromosome partitioning protein ParB [Histophilus somni]
MTKDEKRLAAIAKGLNVSPISNTAPSYQTATPTHYSSDIEYITVTLDKLRPYEHNPRKTRNPNFEMIKESIRRRGLDHKPNITRRPGEDFYIIADGGNTRIQALKELFTETKDPKFWSISCQYKPWQGETADSVEAELNLLIGHLIENDTRADLSFIEKALGILQAKEYYEKKLDKSLSSRELSSELENDGYIISHALILKMERCVNYLYPHIPEVLFSGLGHTQIDKLLAIRNNAEEVWAAHQFDTDVTFESLWSENLSKFNEATPFQAKEFQSELITAMVEALEGKVSFETLYLDIDLDEQKFKKIAAKQQEIDSLVEKTVEQISARQEQQAAKSEPVIKNENKAVATPTAQHIIDEVIDDNESDDEQNNVITDLSQLGSPLLDNQDNQTEDYISQIAHNFGLTPGMSIQEQREQRAEANGLTFACEGRQPVEDIWLIHPARQYRSEAYSLALDIAESVGIIHLVEHIVKQPVDYTYAMKPANNELSPSALTLYSLLSMLQTAEHKDENSCVLDSKFLFELDDLTLVKIFRLIRVSRYIHQQGEEND